MHSLIRETKREDAEQVMLLSHQLGYSISLQQTLQNIEQLLSTTDNCCYVAVLHNEVVGWTHAFKAVRIESNPFVEIGGLVVKDAARGKGIGKELINHVKQWSIEKNIFVLRLRCNTKRKDSIYFTSILASSKPKSKKYLKWILPTNTIIIMPNDLSYQIEIPTRNDYPAIISVWEASVRATHDFLREEDIQTFKPLILNQYLDAVQLHCIKLDDVIVAFLGTSAEKIEMLFADPNHHGKGLGKELLLYAIHTLKKKGVDVNEQNENAVLFYKHFGFEVVNRSEEDGTGKPYPLLHMQLKK